MKVLSIKANPSLVDEAIRYFQLHWANDANKMVYDDCLRHCLTTENPLPQWYLLMDESRIVGCAGLITNDFISRMDLYPWLCALYIEEDMRGHNYGKTIIDKIKTDSKDLGFHKLYLCSDHVGYYERFGFKKIGIGYHPWNETSSIFSVDL